MATPDYTPWFGTPLTAQECADNQARFNPLNTERTIFIMSNGEDDADGRTPPNQVQTLANAISKVTNPSLTDRWAIVGDASGDYDIGSVSMPDNTALYMPNAALNGSLEVGSFEGLTATSLVETEDNPAIHANGKSRFGTEFSYIANRNAGDVDTLYFEECQGMRILDSEVERTGGTGSAIKLLNCGDEAFGTTLINCNIVNSDDVGLTIDRDDDPSNVGLHFVNILSLSGDVYLNDRVVINSLGMGDSDVMTVGSRGNVSSQSIVLTQNIVIESGGRLVLRDNLITGNITLKDGATVDIHAGSLDGQILYDNGTTTVPYDPFHHDTVNVNGVIGANKYGHDNPSNIYYYDNVQTVGNQEITIQTIPFDEGDFRSIKIWAKGVAPADEDATAGEFVGTFARYAGNSLEQIRNTTTIYRMSTMGGAPRIDFEISGNDLLVKVVGRNNRTIDWSNIVIEAAS